MKSKPPSSQDPKRCHPPLVRETPKGPCVARPFITPFGGPASGLWPSGGSPPIPEPSCTIASIFADCFRDCTGTISEASPGPICGWTFEAVFGPLGGTITFTPGSMAFNTANATEFPGATKPIPQALGTVNGLTGQFQFTAPNAQNNYNFVITNSDLSEIVLVGLFADGNVGVQVGPPADVPFYTGMWVPTTGPHKVHFSINQNGVPSLFIDGVETPLAFVGTVFSFASSLPPNVAAFFVGLGSAAPASTPVMNAFVTRGVLGPETEFCCPR